MNKHLLMALFWLGLLVLNLWAVFNGPWPIPSAMCALINIVGLCWAGAEYMQEKDMR